MHPTHFEDPVSGFPGDKCEYDSDCNFGPRRCNNHVCEGVPAWEECLTSLDCRFGHYCANFDCVPLKQPVPCGLIVGG